MLKAGRDHSVTSQDVLDCSNWIAAAEVTVTVVGMSAHVLMAGVGWVVRMLTAQGNLTVTLRSVQHVAVTAQPAHQSADV